MSFLSILRSRTFTTLAVLAVIGAALLTVPALANATPTPYPPTTPSSGAAPTSASQGSGVSNVSNNQSGGTASTGFAALTATGIAIALLGGGVALVVVGRRRRHT